MSHIGHMRTISIRELHTRTGHYVRSAQTESVAVTERGKLIAILQAARGDQLTGNPFPPRTIKDLVRVRPGSLDSAKMISEDRDRG